MLFVAMCSREVWVGLSFAMYAMNCSSKHAELRRPSAVETASSKPSQRGGSMAGQQEEQAGFPDRPCGEGGPSLTAATRYRVPGKPPFEQVDLELVVRNPTRMVVWLVLDYPIEIAIIEAASIHRLQGSNEAHLWQFRANSGTLRAIRIAPASEITVRGVDFDVRSDQAEIVFGFADEIRLDGTSAPNWLGTEGLSTRGVVELKRDWYLDVERERRATAAQTALVVSVLCIRAARFRTGSSR
jgi:hypothetical protein